MDLMTDSDGLLEPQVLDQALYNRCLFKTIPVNELIGEVKKRYIKFGKDESYHILSLKLRAHILKESGADIKYIKPILDELRFLGASNSNKDSYRCCFQVRILQFYKSPTIVLKISMINHKIKFTIGEEFLMFKF